MRIPTASARVALLVLALFVVSACSSEKARNANAQETKASSTPAASTPAATLERLGFHVFKEPVPLPDRPFVTLEGKATSLGSLAGSVTLLNFWATWCPPCRKEMPSIERLKAAMEGENFRIVAISTGEDAETVRAFLGREDYTFPVYLDESGELGAEFASQGIPTTYIVDARGMIVAGAVGAREYDDPAVIAVLREMSR